METSTKFSTTELVLLISNAVISKLFLVYPSTFSALGASATIILALFTAVLGLIFTNFLVKLYKSKTDISQIIQNKCIKISFSVITVILFVLNQGYFVRSVAESIKLSILPDSSLFFITLIYMAGVLICARTGLKSIVRAHSFVTPFTIAFLVLLMVLSSKNFDVYNIFPIFGNGYKMLPYILVLVSYFEDFILLMFIIPFTCEKTNFKKIIIPSYIISSAALIAVMTLYTLTTPYTVSDTFFIPIYQVARYINFHSFIARMESVFTIGWILSYFLTSSTYIYVSAMLTGRMFGAKTYRPYIYVICLIIFGLSFIPKDTEMLVEISRIYAIPRLVAGMILPVIILIFKKRGKNNEKAH